MCKRNAIKTAIILSFVLVAAMVFFYDEPRFVEHKVTFASSGNRLSGTLVLPRKEQAKYPIVIFVHGDGPSPYDGYGYYTPMWNRLAENGIASFAWDKPGVNDSTEGNWEHQSMDDRADEVIHAMEFLKDNNKIDSSKIGLWGISQAGWVLPLVATKSNYPKFMIIVSGAINWMDQGAYLTRNRLAREGFSQKQIQEAVEYRRKSEQLLHKPETTYEEYMEFQTLNLPEFLQKTCGSITADRFRFARLNWHYDARNNLKDIKSPVLAVFGDKDMNVNFTQSASIYRNEFRKSGHSDLTIRIFSDATHSLLKAGYFPKIVTTEMDPISAIWLITKLNILGDDAFVDGYLDLMTDWVVEKTNKF